MKNYLLKRFFLLIPTLLGIMALNFFIVQLAPGGPIEQIISKLRGQSNDIDSRLSGNNSEFPQNASFQESPYDGARGIDPQFIKNLEREFGFDQPLHKRFFQMIEKYLKFDFGKSYFRDRSVINLIKEKLPTSLSLGIWTTLLVYLISIPVGIKKAVKDGSFFDIGTSIVIIIAYAIPAFLFALFLIILFAGGSFWNIFPLRGLYSDDFNLLPWYGKIFDYFWHLALPLTAITLSGFAKLTLLTKNSFLEEIHKQYVLTAQSKGLNQTQILYRHVFRNAMLIIISSFPAAFISLFFTSSLLIEVLFSLDGLGLLGFEAAIGRDYPVIFGTLYIFTLLGMMMHIIGDILYMIIDPRINLDQSRL